MQGMSKCKEKGKKVSLPKKRFLEWAYSKGFLIREEINMTSGDTFFLETLEVSEGEMDRFLKGVRCLIK